MVRPQDQSAKGRPIKESKMSTRTVSIRQSHAVMAILAQNVDWDSLDSGMLQEGIIRDPTGAGRQFTSFLRNGGKMVIKNHIINCGAFPFVPDGWRAEWHQWYQESAYLKLTREGDDLFLDGKKIAFHLSPNQMGDKSIRGENLRVELAKEPVLNANVLDYLLAHPDLIPDSWAVDDQGRTRYLFFWGTVYHRSDGRLCVRFLYRCGDRWRWGQFRLGNNWSVSSPAAVLAS